MKTQNPAEPIVPEELSPEAGDVFKRIADARGIWGRPDALEVLRTACEQRVRARQAREDIAVNGLTVKDRFQQTKPNPAVMVERQAAKTFASLLNQLPYNRFRRM